MNDLHVTYVWMIALCIYRYQSSFVWFRFLDHYSHTLQYHLAYEQRSLECLDWIPIVFSDWTALGRKEPSVRQFFLWMALFCLMLSNSGFKVQIHIWIWYSHIIIWGVKQADDFNTFPHRSKCFATFCCWFNRNLVFPTLLIELGLLFGKLWEFDGINIGDKYVRRNAENGEKEKLRPTVCLNCLMYISSQRGIFCHFSLFTFSCWRYPMIILITPRCRW